MPGVKGMKWSGVYRRRPNVATTLSEEDFDRLQEIAKKHGWNPAQTSRYLIEYSLQKYEGFEESKVWEN